jgi:hypothetical protein
MPVVDGSRLNRFMSNPKWSPSQAETAEQVCAQVTASLEAALYRTHIEPVEVTESAPISARSGLVDLSYPVLRVLALGDATLAEDDPIPDGWTLRDHRLYRIETHLGSTVFATVVAASSGLPFFRRDHGPAAPRYNGAALVRYLAGWGDEPALTLAILRKAQTLMGNRHDDTVTVRALDAQAPPKLGPEIWTEEELAPLGVYRRLGA